MPVNNQRSHSEALDVSVGVPPEPGVYFNADAVTLQGSYKDELSAFRARRGWIEALEANFLLEEKHDFSCRISGVSEQEAYLLTCNFTSACARYAFWRLTNGQAPEAQYLIETSHIPNCDSRHDEFLSAPDLRSVTDKPCILTPGMEHYSRTSTKDLIDRMMKSILDSLK